jgi:hypothetical protein
MGDVRVQWLSSDKNLFEFDWLSYLVSDIQDHIDTEYEWKKIKTDKNTILICNHAVPYRHVLEELRQKGKKYVLVLLSDENLLEPCEWLHDPNCVGLLRNYIHPNQLNHPKVSFFGLGYKREFTKYLKTEESAERSLAWSFAGTPHGDRQSMLEAFQIFKNNQIHTCSGFGADDGLSTKKYVNMLRQSTFALCPEGQDSMDSFRLYEALEAGCIPITKTYSKQFMIKPSYWHGIFRGIHDLPFIYGDTWEECVERVKTIPTEEVRALKEDCETMWIYYKQLWKNNFKKYYDALSN